MSNPYYPNGMPTSPAAAHAQAAAAAERYAAVRLTQAVRAGLIAQHTFDSLKPGQYAAAWRMVSQHVNDPAQQAGYADAGYWLRQYSHPGAQPAPGPSSPVPGDPAGAVPTGMAGPTEVAPPAPQTHLGGVAGQPAAAPMQFNQHGLDLFHQFLNQQQNFRG